MGSVTEVYTTGDNDPEIYPTQYFRHYLYCDGCGAFELAPWMVPENHQQLETSARRLSRGALYSAALILMPLGQMLGLGEGLWFLVMTVAGIFLLLTVRSLGTERAATHWHHLVAVLPWVLATTVAWVATQLLMPWWALVVGTILVAGLLAWSSRLRGKVEVAGVICGRCRTTYRNGAPIFTDLDANPRALTVADVPSPLGSSYFVRGEGPD